MRFPFKKIWVFVKFWYISHRINSCKQWTNYNYTKLHTFPREQIIFLSITLFKLGASSSEKKVADFSEQCSRHVSSVVSAYWNPWKRRFDREIYIFWVLSTILKHGCVLSSNFGGKNSEKEFILNQWTGLQNIAEAVHKICLIFCSLLILVPTTLAFGLKLLKLIHHFWDFLFAFSPIPNNSWL